MNRYKEVKNLIQMKRILRFLGKIFTASAPLWISLFCAACMICAPAPWIACFDHNAAPIHVGLIILGSIGNLVLLVFAAITALVLLALPFMLVGSLYKMWKETDEN